VVSYVRARAPFLMTITAQTPLHLSFPSSSVLTEVSHETVARRPLTQPSRQFGPLRSLSLWRGVNFEIAHATLSSLCPCQIALVVARCECWARSRNSRHLGPVRSLLLWRGGNFGSCQETSLRELVQGSCQETSYRDLLQRHCMEICWDLAKRSLKPYRDLAKRALIDSFYRDLKKRSHQDTSYRELCT